MRLLEERRADVVREILSLLEGEPRDLYEAASHLVRAGGKRHRPVMTLLAAESVGGDPDDAIGAAASVELIHTFSLVQDDIFDNDELRRGVPAVHVEWDEDTAILASDLLFSKAFEALSKAEGDPAKVQRALWRLSVGCTRITEGQSLDMSTPSDDGEYLRMIDRKTAELHALACHLGALMGGGSDDQVEVLEEFGRKCGLAFQIKDDVLDLTAEEGDLGKPQASDLTEGKRTLIVLHALNRGSERVRELFEGVTSGVADPTELVDALREGGHVDYAEDKAEELMEEAKDAVSDLPGREARDDLLEVADYLVDRSH